jgi:hypothetical protein
VLVHRRGCRLHDEDIRPTNVLVNLERDLRVWKPVQPGAAKRNIELIGNFPGERRMGAPAEQLELAVTHGRTPA